MTRTPACIDRLLKASRRSSESLGAVLLVAALCAACTSLHDDAHPFEEGWRMATVAEFPLAEHPGMRLENLDCSADLSGTQNLAVVRYKIGRRVRHRLVVLPREEAWRVGDPLYIDMRDCRHRGERHHEDSAGRR